MITKLLLPIVALTVFAAAPSIRPAAGAFTENQPDTRLQGSYRFDRNGWVYIHLEGAPQQIGYQHGYLLSKETSDHLRVAKPFLLHETKRD